MAAHTAFLTIDAYRAARAPDMLETAEGKDPMLEGA
jgi:hypothetical protein